MPKVYGSFHQLQSYQETRNTFLVGAGRGMICENVDTKSISRFIASINFIYKYYK